MYLELGGGIKPYGQGYLNLDLLPGADIHCDLAAVGRGEIRLPMADDEVEALYTAHCLEHLPTIMGSLWEIVRVCRVGAPVEIRLPHWLHDSAMADSWNLDFCGHHHSYGPIWWSWITQTDDHEIHWPGTKKLRLDRIHYQPEKTFARAKEIFGTLGMTDDEIFTFIPETCHEVHYHFTVVQKDET